ncbi:hypothetical protein N7468_001487 [Penicillium chermesinum]|uniref:Uncharacterized protein n=1 Tax=Penicillium chermesinum TaxID=63820 RepID=A0A9W9TYP8_9EURO|nr:uncharacterized protein N7468_001487 [Penicillium chermesinum]KAJ5246504.1 hypothetical protein N7468_001487 [Penicillium chermesinum]KAJ6144773.1 hypothetical protein N7470_008668 [Penicillium chermesinum]
MKFITLAPSVLALATGILGMPSLALKRNPTGSFGLVAYGIEKHPIAVFYSDGLADAGDSSKWTHGSLTTEVSSDDLILDSNTLLYILTTDGEATPVGFTGNGRETPANATTENFIFFMGVSSRGCRLIGPWPARFG